MPNGSSPKLRGPRSRHCTPAAPTLPTDVNGLPPWGAAAAPRCAGSRQWRFLPNGSALDRPCPVKINDLQHERIGKIERDITAFEVAPQLSYMAEDAVLALENLLKQAVSIRDLALQQEAALAATEGTSVCNLYSITTNQAAIIALFRVVNRYVGNLSRIAQLDQRTALPDQCLHSAEADVRPPRRKSGFDRYCRKSLFALLMINSPSRRRGDLINVWGKASKSDELASDFGNGLAAYRRTIVACFVFRRNINRKAVWDFFDSMTPSGSSTF